MSSHIARTEGAVRTVLKISQKSEIGDLVVQIATWSISRLDTLQLQQFKLWSDQLCRRHSLCMRSYSTILKMLKPFLREWKSFLNGMRKSELRLIKCG